MPQTSNLPIVDPNDSIDLQVNELFDNYFTKKVQVDANVYDLTKSFFLNFTNGSQEATATLTSSFLIACEELDIFPQDMIQNFSKDNNAYTSVISFLNLSRSARSLIGFTRQLQPSTRTNRQIRL